MKIQIVMPQMGQSVAEGTIISWKKKVGDAVEADEVLLEVETDKTTVEVESPASGTLDSCLKQAGETAAAGEPIGAIEDGREAGPAQTRPAANTPHAAGGAQEQITVSAQGGPEGRRPASLPDMDRDRYSPCVLRLALFNHLSIQDLAAIRGTGRLGRVTKNDILEFLARRPICPVLGPGEGREEPTHAELEQMGKVIPMTSVRRTIADHLIQSLRTSAHVTMVHAVDMTHLVGLRDRVKEKFQQRFKAKLTYTGVMLFVTARVLKSFPTINASVFGTNMVLHKAANIGCAVALSDESLVVPVVMNADKKTFPDIARDLDRLISLSRSKSLKRADVENGTFTISNFGAFGSLIGTPLINQPQVAILGMGAVFKTPVVVEGQIVIRDLLYLSFSFDHRVIDGAMGGRFLNAIQVATEALTEDELNLESL